MAEYNSYPANKTNICCFVSMMIALLSFVVGYALNLNYPNFMSFMFICGSIAMMIFIFTIPESDWFRTKK